MMKSHAIHGPVRLLAVVAATLAVMAMVGSGCSSAGAGPGATSITSARPPQTITEAAVRVAPAAASPATNAASVTVVAPVTIAPVTSTSSLPVTTLAPAPRVVFAVIGDYGVDDRHEGAVAELVGSWSPAYILTLGDDYYGTAGRKGTARYDESTGAHYGRWLADIATTGKRCPKGLASTNAFFPALGNHDYSDGGIENYLKYFSLPGDGFSNTSGNERYYDFVQGPVHFFVLNSTAGEPDGTTKTSTQALWLKKQLAASTSTWNIVYDHHPPYSSDLYHGPSEYMRWPFAEWGADAVLSGHSHTYERIERDSIVYFVNGLGGASRYFFGRLIEGDRARYRADWGAQRVTVTADTLIFEFWNTAGQLVDSCGIPAD